MAQVQGEEIYLSHSGQEVDDNIDEVQAARGTSASLSAMLAGIVSDFEADQQRQEAEIGVVAARGAKNLLEYNGYGTGAENGVTYTINTDGTITVNGTPQGTSPSYIELKLNGNAANIARFCDGQHILSGCPAGGGDNKYRMYAARSTYSRFDYGNGVRLADTTLTDVRLVVYIANGYTANNLVFKPMIRRAEITDSTYASYAPTNRELYEMIMALPGGGTSTVITDLMGYTWEQGTSDDSGNFSPGTVTTRMLCQTYFDIPANSNAIKANGVANASPLLFLADFYRDDKSFISELGWTNDYLIIPQQAKYVRFILRYENGTTTITPAQLSSCNMIIALQSVQSLRSAPASLMQAGRLNAELTDEGTDESEEEER